MAKIYPPSTLLGLPCEIRHIIYSYTVELEQENQREWIGNHQHSQKSDLATPLFKVRPPSLIRVCETTRQEYLPFFFEETCFRVYVDVDSDVMARSQWSNRIVGPADCMILEEQSKAWLDSIRSSEDVRFRNVQFRMVARDGRPFGAGLNIAYKERDRKYECQFMIDEAWDVAWSIDKRGYKFNVSLCPRHVWRLMKKFSEGSNKEFLDWKTLAHLIEEFHARDMVFRMQPGVAFPSWDLENWSDEVRLLEA